VSVFRMIMCRRVSSIGLRIYHGLRAADLKANMVSARV